MIRPLTQSDRLGAGAKHGLSVWPSTSPMHVIVNVPKAFVMPFAHNLYDDPAFSPDPLSHPFFALAQDPWPSPPAAMRALPPLSTPSTIQYLELDDSYLTQPFTTSTWADDCTTTTSHETTSSNVSTSSSNSTTPTSYDSHSSEVPSAASTKPSFEKKKHPMSLLWRKKQADTRLHTDNHKLRHRPEPPPSYEAVLSSSPPSTRDSTAPDLLRTSERFAHPTRSATKKPPPARRVVAGVSINAHELDRIDELDESSPMGLPFHHDGPYEAILKSLLPEPKGKTEPHNIGSQYQAGAKIVYDLSLS